MNSDYLFLLIQATLVAFATFLFWDLKRHRRWVAERDARLAEARRKADKDWVLMHPTIRSEWRHFVCWQNVVREMMETHPGDLKCVWQLMETRDGYDVGVLLPENEAIEGWNGTSGRKALRHLAAALAHVDQHQSGLLDVLVVMLDEQRDRLRIERAKQIMNATTN